MDFNEAKKHFPTKISKSLANYARDVVFKASRYLFVWRIGKVQMAFCTHCKVEYPLGVGQASYKHNEKTTCLSCQSECTVKSHGRGRKHLADFAYLVWYEKSAINKGVVVARAFEVRRDYSGDYRSVETEYTTWSWYVFIPGRGGFEFRRDWGNKIIPMKSVGSYVEPRVVNYYFGITKEAYCSTTAIKRAVRGTPLQYSMWHEYEDETVDFVKFFNLAAKYPCIEYLTKLGMKKLVVAKMLGHQTYNSVYWRGKTMEKVLRMSKAEIKQFVNVDNVLPKTLHSYQYWRKQGLEVTPEQAKWLQDLTDEYYLKRVRDNGFSDPIHMIKYLLRQRNRDDAPTHFRSATSVLQEWYDNVQISKELGMDMTQEHVVFPSKLHETHDKNSLRVKMKRDEELNIRIAARAQELMNLMYSDDKFIIRPATSSIELFQEGKVLSHCVGSYSGRYASGQCDVFVVRLAAEPEKPFVTVEVSESKIRQARGYKNSDPQPEVKEFLTRFSRLLNKGSKKAKKSKSRAA